MTKEYPSHIESIVALKRIEGQVRGIQRMVEDRKYCVDILNQLHAVMRALASVEDKVLDRHLNSCVRQAMQGGSEGARAKKLEEVLQLVRQFRKL
jgi:CsoR family transcriptional regulator, copper-sensing transcriptional repressor